MTGVFEANGAGSELSRAQVFAKGQYPVIGRFNLGTPNPNAGRISNIVGTARQIQFGLKFVF